MTDQPEPLPPALQSPIDAAPPAPAPAAPASARKGGGMGAILIVGAIAVFLAVVLFLVKDNTAADDLKVGDCFDIPTATSVSTVTHHACTEAHTAEVFHVVEYNGSDLTVPITFVLGGFVDDTCGPVFKTYVGKDVADVPDLGIGYFYPSSESWSSGDRTITCYASRTDEATMTKSVKGSAGS